MAKGQLQGRAGAVWMIVFAALWLTSTVFLVIMYTGQAELKDQNEKLLAAKAKLISSSEERSVELFKSASPQRTAVGLLEAARAQTAEVATGEKSDDAGAVASKRDELLRTIREDGVVSKPKRFDGTSYHEALTILYGAFKSENTLRTNAQDRVGQLEAEVDHLAKATNQQKNDFDQRAKELADQLAEAEAQRDQFRQQHTQQLADLGRDFEDRRQQTEVDLTKERQDNKALQDQVSKLEERLAAISEVLPGPKDMATARQADGRLLTAITGDDVVYINRGRQHRLTLGLRFAVYPAGAGIPVDGNAKGQIEVVSIGEETAECAIRRVSPGQVLLEGDLIANPIYDPERSVNFLVLGEFDLDRDGLLDRDGGAFIESMVADWGGTIQSELTALTDFVVVGAAPRRPRTPRDDSPDATARFAARSKVYDQYMDTVSLAKSLGVPILNQQTFLNFLGYTGRLAQR